MPQVPLQITFRHMPHSDAVETLVRDKVDKLEEFYPALISCRVVIEKEALHHQQGHHFNVRLDLHVPGHEFATTREHHEDFDIATGVDSGRLFRREPAHRRSKLAARQHGGERRNL